MSCLIKPMNAIDESKKKNIGNIKKTNGSKLFFSIDVTSLNGDELCYLDAACDARPLQRQFAAK